MAFISHSRWPLELLFTSDAVEHSFSVRLHSVVSSAGDCDGTCDSRTHQTLLTELADLSTPFVVHVTALEAATKKKTTFPWARALHKQHPSYALVNLPKTSLGTDRLLMISAGVFIKP